MTLRLYTAAPPCADADAVDVGRHTALEPYFGPSRQAFIAERIVPALAKRVVFARWFVRDMEASLARYPERWRWLLRHERAVLVSEHVQHRLLLARLVVQVGAAQGVEVWNGGELATAIGTNAAPLVAISTRG